MNISRRYIASWRGADLRATSFDDSDSLESLDTTSRGNFIFQALFES